MQKEAFDCSSSVVSNLAVLDVSNKELEVDKEAFATLNNIRNLYTTDKVLCCVYFLQFPLSKANCFSPEDELSSCTDLLASFALRLFLWLQSAFALFGNGAVLIYRLFFEKRSSALGFHVFVISLSLSDFMMGFYLSIIGSADVFYRGQFLWQRWEWKRTPLCTLAGIVGLVSSEVSAFTICLIMLDRLLAVKFPLHRQFHFSWKSATVASTLSWIIGVALSLYPLLPSNFHWEFYRQNGICLPLPITRQDFAGHNYALSVFLVLNFTIFMIIGIGQILIYFTVQASKKISSSANTNDVVIARRLFIVVFSDFCCWFPVGVMGVMATIGVPIPGDVNVWTAVFILPLNSALNPFLYTFSKYRQKREAMKEEKRYQDFVKRFKILHAQK